MGRKSKGKKRKRDPAERMAPTLPSSPPSRIETASRTSVLRDAALILVIGIVVFANSLANGFVYDDIQMIEQNLRLDHPWDLGRFVGTSYWDDAAVGGNLYRPLTVWSFALDRLVFGAGPKGVHAMNVLANGLIGALVYLLLLRLSGQRLLAGAAALLYVVHPVHTEVVANGVGRSELYGAIMLLAAALLHLSWQRRAIGRALWEEPIPGFRPGARALRAGRVRLAGALTLYFIGLLLKESVAVLPGLLFLADWVIGSDGRLLPVLGRLPVYLLYGLPLAVYLAIRHSVVGSALPAIQEVMGQTDAFGRILYASETLLRYIGQTLVPWRLSGEYSDYRNFIDPSLAEPMVLASLLTWLGLGVCLVQLTHRNQKLAVYGVAWFFLTIVPVSNLFFAIGTVRADRLLFVPSLGIMLVVAWALVAFHRRHRGLASGLFIVILLLYSARTVVRNRDWRDQETFWTKQLELNPGSPISWSMLGDTLEAKGEPERAEEAFREAIELRDGRGNFYPESHTKIAGILSARGDRAGAEAEYRLVVDNRPEHFVALLNLGEMKLGDPDTVHEAIELLHRAASVKPGDFRSHANLSQAYRVAGQPENALNAIDRALELRPDIASLSLVRAEILQQLGRSDEPH